ncbi:MAG: thioredoxin fold domain-containing protein [Psychrobium sp.]
MFAKFIKKCALVALPASLLMTSISTFAEITQAEKSVIAKKFASVRPELVVSDVEKTDIDGMYLLNFSGKGTVYYVPKGDYFFTGDLLQIDGSRFVNVKEKRMEKPRKTAIAAIDESEMIIYPAKGKKKASITVFTDVDCGYCRKLHKEMAQINDLGIEVRYLAYPRAGINSPSYNKVVSAWCSDNKQDALTKLKNGQPVYTSACKDNPVAQHFILGNRLGVTGTPAIIMESGELLPGYLPADKLAEALGVKG